MPTDLPELLRQIEINLKPDDWRKRKRGHSRADHIDDGVVHDLLI